MPIWKYQDISSGVRLRDVQGESCRFCSTVLEEQSYSVDEVLFQRPGDLCVEARQSIKLCHCCGWWNIVHNEQAASYGRLEGIRSDWTYLTFGTSACLAELNLVDVSLPAEEVRCYLLAKYTARFDLHPRLFEQAVASIFRHLGWHVILTAYTADGGIDVVLHNDTGERVGVQVKRWRGAVRVDQIREFAGSLLLGNYTRGIFITTSSFTRPAVTAAEQLSAKTFPIELLDAKRFYEVMKILRFDKRWTRDRIQELMEHRTLKLLEIGTSSCHSDERSFAVEEIDGARDTELLKIRSHLSDDIRYSAPSSVVG